MKNKKLFAILTLVCFMMTLMPVAAFAADPTLTYVGLTDDGLFLAYKAENLGSNKVVWYSGVPAGDGETYAGEIAPVSATLADGTSGSFYLVYIDAAAEATNGSIGIYDASDVPASGPIDTDDSVVGDVYTTEQQNDARDSLDAIFEAYVAAGSVYNPEVKDGAYGATNLVAYYNGASPASVLARLQATPEYVTALNTIQLDGFGGTGAHAATSTFATVEPGLELDKKEAGKAVVALKDINSAAAAGPVYVWAETANGEASTAFVVSSANATVSAPTNGVYTVSALPADGVAELVISFVTAGEYSLRASLVNPAAPNSTKTVTKINLPAAYNTVKVVNAPVDSEKYTMTFNGEAIANDNTSTSIVKVNANGVETTPITIGFSYGVVLPGLPVNITTNSSSIEVSDENLTTNYKGEVTFYVSGTVEGDYTIDVTCLDYEASIKVRVGSVAASDIELVAEAKAPIALNTPAANFNNAQYVQVAITDVNGNGVTSDAAAMGVSNAANAATKYVSFVEKPAASKLTNKDIFIKHDANGVWDLNLNKALDAEGTYTVKIVLDNGRAVTTSFEVKKFQTPVAIMINKTPATVELGKVFEPQLLFVDANGVTQLAGNKAELTATGYAIDTVAAPITPGRIAEITVKSDEKYAGSVITLTAVSDKYDLVATKEVRVAAEAVAIAFETGSLKANVNNKVEWNVVDANGNAVSLTDATATTIKYVVLDKPADAKVSVVDRTGAANFAGAGEMAITCNKVGNVKVQVIAQVELGVWPVQYKYYTGVQEFAFGTGEVGKSVVMSIGSNHMIVEGKVVERDVQPMIQNGRTFVPFRALAEAFGATVAYDQATSSVSAELNGVKVVMTVGAPVYTVNGVEKTADVAPFIADSRTFVPVRFAAEAFGITVTPTYNADGSVADVLFNM